MSGFSIESYPHQYSVNILAQDVGIFSQMLMALTHTVGPTCVPVVSPAARPALSARRPPSVRLCVMGPAGAIGLMMQ